MRVYKCDRCGKIYTPHKNCPIEDRSDHTYHGVEIKTLGSLQYADGLIRDSDELDLCASCQLEIFQWLSSHSNEVKEYGLCESS